MILGLSLRYSAVTGSLALLAALGGCSSMYGDSSTTVTYSFDPAFSFANSKTYAWLKSTPVYGQNALVEANVRYMTDRDFQAKGLSLAPDKPALVAWVSYDSDYYGVYSSTSYDLRTLTLNVARADDRAVVWQGRARGPIKADAASGDLKKVVDQMLAHFPPK
jgi:hypothetical protein